MHGNPRQRRSRLPDPNREAHDRVDYNLRVFFEVVGEIDRVETIASGRGIRELDRLQKRYGKASWRKMKGVGEVRLRSGRVVTAELHWYEAHGVGKRELKIKCLLD